MKTNTKPRSREAVFFEELYQKLGYLCYAVATTDGVLSSTEIKMIKKLVKDQWLSFEGTKDGYGSDAAYEVISVFDWLVDEGFSGEEGYIVFEDFYKENYEQFSEGLKKLILQTASEIATAAGTSNKKEVSFLKNLHKLLFEYQKPNRQYND